MIKIDSSSLIYLIKLDLLELIKKLYKTIIITPKVKTEVVDQGKKNNYPDAYVAESLINNGKISLHEVPTNLIIPQIKKIHQAELELIHFAHDENCIVLIDDTIAQRYASTLGLTFRTIPFLLVELLQQQLITGSEFDIYLNKIVSLMNLHPKDLLYLQKCKEVLVSL